MSRPKTAACHGFTLLELMIVVSILAIIASMGVPQYISALRTARIGKAKHELVTISHAIGSYQATNGGQLPLTLYQVGFGGRLDPWGIPYCYLNYADGTGDGLKWAIEAGLVDPAALQDDSSGGGAAPSGGGGGLGPTPLGGSFLPFAPFAPLAPLPARAPAPAPQGLLDKAASLELATRLTNLLARPIAPAEVEALATGITSDAGFTMFVGVPTETTRRRDRYMFPLNTDYDLFSLGPNGRTTVSLGETLALDDVIRANNGGFFGLASDY